MSKRARTGVITTALVGGSEHLNEDELALPQPECSFCGSTDRTAVTLLQSAPDVYLMKCRSCSVCTASRIPTVGALRRYYGAYYEDSRRTGKDESHVTFNNIRRFARHLADVVGQHSEPGRLDILDFGGGDGAISHAMAELLLVEGHEEIAITVVDYHDQVVESTNPAITLKHEPDLAALGAPAEQFDIVIASAIIEHLPDAKEETERLLHLLRRGGVLYVRTPYVVPVLRLMKRFALTLDVAFPGHIHDMGQAFWENYFSRISPSGPHRILHSQPAIVQTSFSEHFLRTCVVHLLKFPWKILGMRYTLVGGWEVFVRKD